MRRIERLQCSFVVRDLQHCSHTKLVRNEQLLGTLTDSEPGKVRLPTKTGGSLISSCRNIVGRREQKKSIVHITFYAFMCAWCLFVLKFDAVLQLLHITFSYLVEFSRSALVPLPKIINGLIAKRVTKFYSVQKQFLWLYLTVIEICHINVFNIWCLISTIF